MSATVLRRLPAYPLLLPLFFVGHGWAQYLFFVPPVDALWLLLRYELAAVLLLLLFRWRMREWPLAAAATFLTLGAWFFFGAAQDGLRALAPDSFLTRYSVLLPLWGALWAGGLWLLRRRGVAARTHRFLSLLMTVLLLIDAGSIALRLARRQTPVAAAPCASCAKPDVYLLLLDGYAGLAQLKEEFGFDNRPFYDTLRGLGFQVADSSSANYQDTPFSMASLLQMQYLPLSHFNYTDSNLNYCYAQVYDNAVARRFRAEGYAVRNLSIFDLKGAPAPCRNTLLVSGAALISSQTLGQRLHRDLYNNIVRQHFAGTAAYRELIFEDRENNMEFAQGTLDEAAGRNAGPRFIYTHLEMPHAPYFYDSAGRLNKDADLAAGNLGRKDLYLGYLQYTSRYVTDLVRRIRAASAQPPVILLLGDHGFRYAGPQRLYYSNLAALSLPPGYDVRYPAQISNVNQFRFLFNTLFRDTLPMLPDRTY